jgi:pimeloyl-ACP methyl ester carboxylesterase
LPNTARPYSLANRQQNYLQYIVSIKQIFFNALRVICGISLSGIAGYFIFQAMMSKTIPGRGAVYSLAESPFSFWLHVGIYVLCVILGAMMAISGFSKANLDKPYDPQHTKLSVDYKMLKKLHATLSRYFPPQIRDEFESTHGLIKLQRTHPQSSKPPVLFVPGSFCGAWIWRDNFFEHFYQAGYDVAAMSFQSHGKRGLPLLSRKLSDFEADLTQAIGTFKQPPIVVAHSLGGLVAQRVAARVPMHALALLSPIPADGVARSVLSLAKKSPFSVFKLASVTITPQFARSGQPPIGIYSSHVNENQRQAVTRRLQAEAPLALLQSIAPQLRRPTPLPCPVHFWGAEGDHIIPASEVQRAAKLVGAASTIVPEMSHTFQAEPNWKVLADDVLAFMKLH